VSAQPPGGEPPQNIAASIAEVSERASTLVREEIELAKAEVTDKLTKLARGAVVGVVAGIFFFFALVMVLFGFAWLLYYYLPGAQFAFFWGFFAMGLILVALGVGAGLIAARALKRGSPPVPTMAIEEAQRIKETVTAGPAAVPPLPSTSASGDGVPAPAPAAPPRGADGGEG
jgi:hypothetical protein